MDEAHIDAAEGKPTWRDLSAFDALDESWIDPPKQKDDEDATDVDKVTVQERPDAVESNAADHVDTPSPPRPADVHDLSSPTTLPLPSAEAATNAATHAIFSLPSNEALRQTTATGSEREHRTRDSMRIHAPSLPQSQFHSSLAPKSHLERQRVRRRRRSSGAMTDSELLQPGPSSPSNRIPSHKVPSGLDAMAMAMFQATSAPANDARPSSLPSSPSKSIAFHDLPPSPSRSTRSVSTSSSGEKQGARASLLSDNGDSESVQTTQNHVDDDVEDDVMTTPRSERNKSRFDQQSTMFGMTNDDQFGSAREDNSTSQAPNVTAREEGTFIEHSDVISPPAFLKPKWANKEKKSRPTDMFAPLALQAMFDPPSPSTSPTRPEEKEDMVEVIADGNQNAVEEDGESPDVDNRHARQGAGSVAAETEQEQDLAPTTETANESVINNSNSSGHVELATHTVDIPRCTFTFSSPIVRPKRAPPTPTLSRAPLRLFPLRGRNSEIEDILNTPRSAAKTRDAKRIVWKLVEEEAGDGEEEQAGPVAVRGLDGREKKRLRMDRIPSPAPNAFDGRDSMLRKSSSVQTDTWETDPSSNNDEWPLRKKSSTPPYIPGQLTRSTLQSGTAHGLPASRTISSSLIAKRKGANAPTPKKAMARTALLSSADSEESPRKLLRRWSAANQVDQELEDERQHDGDDRESWQDVVEDQADFGATSRTGASMRVPSVSINPPPLPLPIAFDAERLPAPIVEHVTQVVGHPGMLRIAPPEASQLDEMEAMANGKMTFDRKMNRWIRVRHLQRSDKLHEDSSDPFRDFESISSPAQLAPQQLNVPKVSSINGSSSDANEGGSASSARASRPLAVIEENGRLAPPSVPSSWSPTNALLTPAKATAADDAHRSITPRSILKSVGPPWPGASSINQATPTQMRQSNRKISFADGINPRGIDDSRRSVRSNRDTPKTSRRQRLNDLLQQLERLAMNSDDDIEGDGSNADDEELDSRVRALDLGDDSQRTPPSIVTPSSVALSSLGAQRSPWNLSTLRASGKRKSYMAAEMSGHASFMTNASFNVAHDRILELLTDVAPWTTRWHDMRTIDLNGRRVESLVRLDEFLPRLEEAQLDNNEISYLTGLPSTLRHLSVAHNHLPTTAAFGHLSNLESLDVSGNKIDLKALRALVHLKHLRANGNGLTSVDGIARLNKLETLHLRDNAIGAISLADGDGGQWPNLRDLILSRNRLESIHGLGTLSKLRCLNLDHNQLSEVNLGTSMPKLKQLRVSSNPDLCVLDVAPAYNLRTLYADECGLNEVKNIGLLRKLDNLSLRQQTGLRSLHWPAHEIRDVKRLFLSGNAFRAIDLSRATERTQMLQRRANAPQPSLAPPPGITQFFGLVYLELSGCQLTSLPTELAVMVPNLRHLNADYNLFDTLPTMTDLRRLKRLSMVGCRIDKSRDLVESVQGCEELAYMDVRMNPCTLGLYPPLVVAVQTRGGADQDGKVNRAFLPPVPHPLFAGGGEQVVQPIAPAAARHTDAQGQSAEVDEDDDDDDDEHGGGGPMGSFAEKSFFHKRRPPPPLADKSADGVAVNAAAAALPPSRGDAQGAVFAATDDRFARTLPAHFRLQRLLHRGTLAMACANLTWLDGLLIDEEEVRQADRYLRRAHASRTDRQGSSEDDRANGNSPTDESLVTSSDDDRRARAARRRD